MDLGCRVDAQYIFVEKKKAQREEERVMVHACKSCSNCVQYATIHSCSFSRHMLFLQ